jgi:argininosuccinate synthase
MKKKVVLAFSGGLDTSYCAKYLSVEKELEVYSVLVNTGGFSAAELTRIKKRAEDLGVKKHLTIDVIKKYYRDCIRFLVYGNVLKNGTYPLSVSAERVFQALAIARYAEKIKADFIAHGSTGAGNDQVRFDLIFNIINPDIEILTPIRDQQLSREDEVRYLRRHGIRSKSQTQSYSINQGLWGTSVGGRETLTSDQTLPASAYPTKVTAKKILDFDLVFDQGQFTAFGRQKFDSPVEAIRALEALAAPYGVGRDIHVGDTIIGIKGRVGFQAAAPILIIKAHQALEKHTLTKWQLYWKEQLASWYGLLLHEGQFLDPVMRDIEVFLESSQKTVSGRVHIRLEPYHFQIKGISSVYDLMVPAFGAYGEKNLAWRGEDVRGFAKILATQSRIYRSIHGDDRR